MRLKVQLKPKFGVAFLVMSTVAINGYSSIAAEDINGRMGAESPAVVAASDDLSGKITGLAFDERWGSAPLGFAGASVDTAPIALPYLGTDRGNYRDSVKNVSPRTQPLSVPNTPTQQAPSRATAPSIPDCGPSPFEPAEIEQLVRETARRHGVDEDYAAAIAWTESKFDRSRNSDAGARGPMQLMPAAAARFGVHDVCDPVSNIDGGVRYLRVLLEEFKNPLLAAAAYNSGEGRIYEHGGIPPFQETVAYVAKVLNRQIGVAMPTPRRKKQSTPSPVASAPGEPTGVIPHEKRGKFVGGVMHF
jgi:hypothetical protein